MNKDKLRIRYRVFGKKVNSSHKEDRDQDKVGGQEGRSTEFIFQREEKAAKEHVNHQQGKWWEAQGRDSQVGVLP